MRLTIEGVSKEYRGGVRALDDFSLDVESGILGLLGPNGAGKSTLMRIISTVTRPSRGCVRWEGVDIAREPDTLRAVLGYLPQDFGIYPHLNAVEFLDYLAAAKGIAARQARARIDALLELLNLTEVRKRPLGGYSGGMRQRVGIAQALLNDPRLLIVDEPTAGLDPEERVRFRNLLTDLAADRVVILSTHIVSDVEASAGHIALIAGGRRLFHDRPEALMQGVVGRVWEWTVTADQVAEVRRHHLVSGTLRRIEGVQLRIVADQPPAAEARAAVPTLEDAYLLHVTRARNGA